MSQAKFTASTRADKCVLSLEQAIYQTTKRERGLVGAICSIYGLNYNTVSAQLNPNNALINEHNLNRNTFLQTAKKLEKAELLRIVKANGRGKTAKFLERVA